tara:strand:+ start:1332 stop:1598 length:267 start_codon:yes stop_codon:yes gene_type:complete
MKYVLVDKGDNIVDRVELDDKVGVTGAKTFFIGRKQIERKEFDNIWKVMSEKEWRIRFESAIREPSSSYKGIEWWKEDGKIIDDELKY